VLKLLVGGVLVAKGAWLLVGGLIVHPTDFKCTAI